MLSLSFCLKLILEFLFRYGLFLNIGEDYAFTFYYRLLLLEGTARIFSFLNLCLVVKQGKSVCVCVYVYMCYRQVCL